MYNYVDYRNEQIYLFENANQTRKIIPYVPYCFVEGQGEQGLTTFDGKRVKKIPRKFANKFNSFEYDVDPATHFIIDNYYERVEKGERPLNNVMFFDIEVEIEKEFPTPTYAKTPVVSIAYIIKFYDGRTLNQCLYLSNRKGESASFRSKKIEQFGLQFEFIQMNDEKELLSKFAKIIDEMNVTILTGWNIDGYDIPYLVNRMSKIVPEISLSPVGIVEKTRKRKFGSGEDEHSYKIVGVSIVDYLDLYKKFNYKEESSYSLSYISQKVLGKDKYVKTDLKELRETNFDDFLIYNSIDSCLVYEIDKTKKYLELAIEITTRCFSNVESIFYSSKYIESHFLGFLRNKRKKVAPNKKSFDQDEDYVGAFVKEPVKGFRLNIFDLDIESLYPNLIITFNMSPDSKVGKHSFKTLEELKRFCLENEVCSAENKVLFSLKETGFIPEILTGWFEERKQYKKKYQETKDPYYDKRQLVQKILLNSVYGVLGLRSFRFYDKDIAEAVTMTGQRIIKTSISYGEEKLKPIGGICVASDTDSCFFSVDIEEKDVETRYKKLEEIAEETSRFLNLKLEEFLKSQFFVKNCSIRFKKEMFAESGLFLKKKHYALKIGDEYEIKGIEAIKTNYPETFSIFLKQIISVILTEGSKNCSLHSVKSLIDQMFFEFQRNLNESKEYRTFSVSSKVKLEGYFEHIDYSKPLNPQIKKGTPVHVKAALAYNWLLRYFNRMDYAEITDMEKIKWLYLKKNKFGIEAIAFKDSNPEEIENFIKESFSANLMYESFLKTRMDSIYEALNWKFSENQIEIF